jgi:hypothetical protein
MADTRGDLEGATQKTKSARKLYGRSHASADHGQRPVRGRSGFGGVGAGRLCLRQPTAFAEIARGTQSDRDVCRFALRLPESAYRTPIHSPRFWLWFKVCRTLRLVTLNQELLISVPVPGITVFTLELLVAHIHHMSYVKTVLFSPAGAEYIAVFERKRAPARIYSNQIASRFPSLSPSYSFS